MVELFSPQRPLKPKRRGKRKPKPQVEGEGGRTRVKTKDRGREEKRRRGEEKEKEREEERRGWRKGRGSDPLNSCVSVPGYRMSMWQVLILWCEW